MQLEAPSGMQLQVLIEVDPLILTGLVSCLFLHESMALAVLQGGHHRCILLQPQQQCVLPFGSDTGTTGSTQHICT